MNDSQCTGLSNKCVKNVCACGDTSGPCDSTTSNECRNGVCMCGENPQCHQKAQDLVTLNVGAGNCDAKKCSYFTVDPSCRVQRGPEACEKITKYYNPLYAGKAVNADGSPADNACDDEKGKYLGTYQCLGNDKMVYSWGLSIKMYIRYRTINNEVI